MDNGILCYMFLAIHVVLAVASVVLSVMGLVSTSKFKLQATGILTVSTLVSGLILTATSSVNLKQACISGMLYLGFITTSAVLSGKKLATAKVS